MMMDSMNNFGIASIPGDLFSSLFAIHSYILAFFYFIFTLYVG